ncbi:MAG TPA: hypothetical protein ENN64_01530 [bacterium]|nr:hypothetical protein [bacterium]
MDLLEKLVEKRDTTPIREVVVVIEVVENQASTATIVEEEIVITTQDDFEKAISHTINISQQ